MARFDDLGDLFGTTTSTQPNTTTTKQLYSSDSPIPTASSNSHQDTPSLNEFFGPSPNQGPHQSGTPKFQNTPQSPTSVSIQTTQSQLTIPTFTFGGLGSGPSTPSITSPIPTQPSTIQEKSQTPTPIKPIVQQPVQTISPDLIQTNTNQSPIIINPSLAQQEQTYITQDQSKTHIPQTSLIHGQESQSMNQNTASITSITEQPTQIEEKHTTLINEEKSQQDPIIDITNESSHTKESQQKQTESVQNESIQGNHETTTPETENKPNQKKAKADEIIAPELPPMLGSIQPKPADIVITSEPKKKLEPSITTLEDIVISAERKPDIKPTTKRKKINPKIFLFGCIGFLFLILFVLGGGLFYFLANPQHLNGIMDPQTVTSLLKIITTVFFGFLFFLGFGFLTINLYRLIVLKNVAKMGFGIGALVGFILIVGSLVMGKNALDTIFAMGNKQMTTSNDLLFVNVPVRKNNEVVFVTMHQNPKVRLIAPIQTYYELNNEVFSKVLIHQIGSDILTSVQLDCGNGQILPLMKGSNKFDGFCYFLTKGKKTLNVILNYNSKESGAPGQKKIPFPLTVASEILLTTSQGGYTVNKTQTEISFGKAPQRIFLDARNVFTDLALPSYAISWDTTNDGNYNIKDLSSIVARFNEPGTQTVRYTIPDIGDFVYPLTFKVEQSDVPICKVKLENIRGVTYNIIADCEEKNGPVVKYDFSIINEKNNKKINIISSKKPQVKYDFPSKGSFLVKLSHATQDGKIGFAESDTLDIGDVDFIVSYDMFFKETNDRQWKGFDNSTDHIFSKTDQTVTLQRIPVRLQMRINGIIPVIQGTNVNVFLDDEPIIASSEGIYEMTITNPNNQILKVIITNQQAQAETTMEIPIIINQPKVIPALKVSPDYVGESPFTVTFDASATSITDPDDQIVFFSWDFGDGKINKNTSQGIIQHQYNYNDEENMGVFNPVVTIQTKKGLVHKVNLDKPITVTKPTQRARINIDSHPSQSAFVGEDVTFSIRTDGVIEEIIWDFDDGETLKLKGRQGVEVTHPFSRPGRFRIRAQITYDNKTIASPTIVLIINEKEE